MLRLHPLIRKEKVLTPRLSPGDEVIPRRSGFPAISSALRIRPASWSRVLRAVLLSLAMLSGVQPQLARGQDKANNIPQVATLAAISTANRQAPASLWDKLRPKQLRLRSAAALVVDRFGNKVYGKQVDKPMPIASITKLMTAMVILDSKLSLEEKITITKSDRDLLRLTGSRLRSGASLSRGELLTVALMASENRAASALARTFPGGNEFFVTRMNQKAESLGMTNSRFTDASGLDSGNVSTARELTRMVQAAFSYPFIRNATTRRSLQVRPYKRRGSLEYRNTNRLLRKSHWNIGLSKTGYINEAGRCLVMQTVIAEQPLVIVLLNSFGKLTPFGDSNRIRKWIEAGFGQS